MLKTWDRTKQRRWWETGIKETQYVWFYETHKNRYCYKKHPWSWSLSVNYASLTLSKKDSESWVFALLAGVGAKALATAKKAKRVAKTFIVYFDCSTSAEKKKCYEGSFIYLWTITVPQGSLSKFFENAAQKRYPSKNWKRNPNCWNVFVLPRFHYHFNVFTIQS